MSRVPLIAGSIAAAMALTAGLAAQPQYPRDIVVTAQYKTEQTSLTSRFTIHVTEAMPEWRHERLLGTLRQGGYTAFLPAFRALPVVGYIQLENRKVELRYARSQATGNGERLVLITDGPVYFISGGSSEEKKRAGYVLSIIELRLDASGAGSGTMAAAARIKPDAEGNVVVDDYAERAITITVTKP